MQSRYGIPAAVTIAQAIDESGWGQSALAIRDHNLFGIKGTGPAGTDMLPTQEYQNGAPTQTQAQFRAYASPSQSLQDYVALLQNNPRYASALNTGGNVQAFAAGLQRGGYATDPDYARKIGAVAHSVSSALSGSSAVTDLKSAPDQPIASQTSGSSSEPQVSPNG